MAKYLLLHNIRSAHNVGSIFRTADGAGVSHIYLSGYTPSPVDRFGRSVEEIAKTSLGAAATVPYTVVNDDVMTFLMEQRQSGRHVVAIELDPRATPLHSFTPPAEVLYVLGNEVDGVPSEVLDRADSIVEIPMRGTKESLNVSVAAGIVLFHLGCTKTI